MMKYGQYFQQSKSVSFLMTFCSRNNFKPIFIQDDFVCATFIQDDFVCDLLEIYWLMIWLIYSIIWKIKHQRFAVRNVCNEAQSCEPFSKANKVGLEYCMLDVLFLYIWSMAKRLTCISVGIQMVVELNIKLWGST